MAGILSRPQCVKLVFYIRMNVSILMQSPEYTGSTKSIPWLLLSWLLMSPEQQQPWYWLCRSTHWGRDKMAAISQTTFWNIYIFNENVWIPIKISRTFIPKGPINNIPALVRVMAWRRPGDKPLSEPIMVRLPTHICVTRPQWVDGFIYLAAFLEWKLFLFHIKCNWNRSIRVKMTIRQHQFR